MAFDFLFSLITSLAYIGQEQRRSRLQIEQILFDLMENMNKKKFHFSIFYDRLISDAKTTMLFGRDQSPIRKESDRVHRAS